MISAWNPTIDRKNAIVVIDNHDKDKQHLEAGCDRYQEAAATIPCA